VAVQIAVRLELPSSIGSLLLSARGCPVHSWLPLSLLRDRPCVSRGIFSGRSLTLAVSGRRPDEAFHVHPKPQAGGGREHGAC
jgi:hypothetical protein